MPVTEKSWRTHYAYADIHTGASDCAILADGNPDRLPVIPTSFNIAIMNEVTLHMRAVWPNQNTVILYM